MTVREWEQRNEGRIEGQFRMACLVMKMKDRIDSLHDIVVDTSGIKLAKAYKEYHVPEFGRTEMDIMRVREKKRQETQVQEIEADESGVQESEEQELKPIKFEISDPDDLMKVREFENQHYRTCRRRYPDFTGAMFTYEAIPTGLGTLYVVKCPCGESISLDGDMA